MSPKSAQLGPPVARGVATGTGKLRTAVPHAPRIRGNTRWISRTSVGRFSFACGRHTRSCSHSGPNTVSPFPCRATNPSLNSGTRKGSPGGVRAPLTSPLLETEWSLVELVMACPTGGLSDRP